jgi:hypothetical protein
VPKEIYCEKCCGEITLKDDLIVVTKDVKLAAYHRECYSEDMREINSLFLSQPINSQISTFKSVILVILAGALFIFEKNFISWIIGFVACMDVIYRVCSWFWYERPLS